MTVLLPDGPSSPRLVQSIGFAVRRRRTMERLRARYGDAFTVQSLNLGRMVMLADPGEVREMFQASPEEADTPDANLGSVLGPGSFFAITGDKHRRQRKLLTPPFHGRRLRAYETLIEKETQRGDGIVAAGDAVPGDAVDHAHHAQRDPRRGLRGRGGRARRAARPAALDGEARLDSRGPSRRTA
ncbi:cytochrome P450 [Paractinoplanes maris]|uniref:cytochrome P450 n=1 Tax=Paractinoplanes maris TaxID=1734446 RepID=UPI0027DEF298|nr:cytochrome P450 [Actinoplanes maris]